MKKAALNYIEKLKVSIVFEKKTLLPSKNSFAIHLQDPQL